MSNATPNRATSSTHDKAEGVVDSAVGSVKKGAGKVLGDRKLTAVGEDQKMHGESKQALGAAKAAIKEGLKRAGEIIGESGDKMEHAGHIRIGNLIERIGDMIEHFGD